MGDTNICRISVARLCRGFPDHLWAQYTIFHLRGNAATPAWLRYNPLKPGCHVSDQGGEEAAAGMLPSAGARAPPAPTKGTAARHIAPPDRARAPASLPPQCALPSRTGIRPRGKASMLGMALLCHLSAVSALATNVACLPYKQNEALLDFSGAKRQRFLHCAHPPPAERARIVPVPQARPCCTTTWAA